MVSRFFQMVPGSSQLFLSQFRQGQGLQVQAKRSKRRLLVLAAHERAAGGVSDLADESADGWRNSCGKRCWVVPESHLLFEKPTPFGKDYPG